MNESSTDVRDEDYEAARWNSDLKPDSWFLQKQELAVKAEIKRRLRAGAMHIETVKTFMTLQQCLSNRQPHGLPFIDEILEWHHLAVNRVPPGGRGKDLLELSMARLFALKGDRNKAITYFDKAIATSRHDPAIRIRKALFLISIDRWDEARMIPDQVQGEIDWRQQFSTDMWVLYQALERTAPVAVPDS